MDLNVPEHDILYLYLYLYLNLNLNLHLRLRLHRSCFAQNCHKGVSLTSFTSSFIYQITSTDLIRGSLERYLFFTVISNLNSNPR